MSICKHHHIDNYGLLNCYCNVDGTCVHKSTENGVCPFDVRNSYSDHFHNHAIMAIVKDSMYELVESNEEVSSAIVDLVWNTDELLEQISNAAHTDMINELGISEEDAETSYSLA